MKQQTIEHEGASVTVRRQTYGQRQLYLWLISVFVSALADDAPQEEQVLQSARSSFCYTVSHATAAQGLGFELPVIGESVEALEAKFKAFLELDAEFVDQWVEAAYNVQTVKPEGNFTPAPATSVS